MTARALLVRGLAAGLLAGLATFLVAHQVGEPPLAAAVALEQPGHHHDAAVRGADAPAEEDPIVSRGTQRTWGLLTGSLAVGTALGGLVALGAAVAAGRVGRLNAATATAVVAVIGFVAVALVPFLKYPANPPAVGSAETLGARTEYYFVFLLISVVTAVSAAVLSARTWTRLGTWGAVLLGAGTYLVVVTTVGVLMPTVSEVGDFPADTLWYFRRASLLTLATLWAALGIVLSGLVGRLERHEDAAARRRALADAL